ncbi:MAG: BMC domain-containing protein [Candidatus Eisenbacteria bacterium]
MPDREAIGLVETISIAVGIRITDEMAKTAPVEILESTAICPGKFMVLVSGRVSPVEAALKRGTAVGGDVVVDTLFIPNVHPGVFPAILGATDVGEVDALGIVETFTVASSISAADAAAKAARVTLIEIRLAKGLGGKAFFTFTGEVHEVEAAMDAALEVVKRGGNLVRSVVIPRPHADTIEKVL